MLILMLMLMFMSSINQNNFPDRKIIWMKGINDKFSSAYMFQYSNTFTSTWCINMSIDVKSTFFRYLLVLHSPLFLDVLLDIDLATMLKIMIHVWGLLFLSSWFLLIQVNRLVINPTIIWKAHLIVRLVHCQLLHSILLLNWTIIETLPSFFDSSSF